MAENETETTKRKRNQYPDVTPERFVETWNRVIGEGKTPADVAAELGMPKGSVLARKANYIKPDKSGNPGIPLLPVNRKNPRKLDRNKLTEVANKAAGVSTEG